MERTWWETVCDRLDPPTRFMFAVERTRQRNDVAVPFVVDAFVRAADYAIVERLPPPSFLELQQFFWRKTTADEQAWRAVTDAFVKLGEDYFSAQGVRHTLGAIRRVPNTRDRETLDDLLVGRILAADDPNAFVRGMTEVESFHGPTRTSAFLLRGATSLPDLTATKMERILRWSVEMIGRAPLPESVAAALDSGHVRTLVTRSGYKGPKALREHCRNKTARRWLDQVTSERRGGWQWWSDRLTDITRSGSQSTSP
jgi:hypothetical protein